MHKGELANINPPRITTEPKNKVADNTRIQKKNPLKLQF